MELINFSITNFRSITKAHKIPLSNITTLVGKNNEGKSNILKALNIAMLALRSHSTMQARRYSSEIDHNRYFWLRDFPISYQERKGSANQSIFTLEFKLSDDEIAEFKRNIKSTLNGTIAIEIRIGKENNPEIKVSKRGPHASVLQAKSKAITNFIAEKIHFTYIPTIRTDADILDVVSDMLSEQLKKLEENSEYITLLEQIKEFQAPILDNLSNKIKIPLEKFLPNIQDVKIEISDFNRRISQRRNFDIIINDGTATKIEYKGDGVKSLAALSLLKDKGDTAGVSVIAIEEPESHLHPDAIHQLRDIIYALSEEYQIVITTHNPLFINRQSIKSNIIIDAGKANHAKHIKEIRDVLGVKASDNLTNANYSLIVEGEDDEISLRAILQNKSVKLKKFLDNATLVIVPTRGAGKLSYNLNLLSGSLCLPYVYFDNDDAGRKAVESAIKEGLLKDNQYNLTICNGFSEAEFEDLLNIDIYADRLKDEFGVDIRNNPQFRGNKKWSERIRNCFLGASKLWSDEVEKRIKQSVARCVSTRPGDALSAHHSASVESLICSLEELIKE